MHIYPEIEQAEVAAGIIPHINAVVYLEGAGHDIGHVTMLVGDQRMEGDVFAGLFGAEDRTACEDGSGLERESGRSPDRDEIRFKSRVCLLFVSATAFAGHRQADDSYQGRAYQELPYQFPQFYGAQI
jgi:hypothetical protein